MKSLLVDVLRQSQDDAPDEDHLQSPVGRQSESPPPRDTERADSGDLDLMATGQYETAPAAARAGPVEPPAEQEPGPAAETGLPLGAARNRLADTTALSKLGANLHSRSPIVIRLGRMAPVFCLLSIVGVASGYLVLNKLTSGSLNEDLDELSEIVQFDAGNAAAEIGRAQENFFRAADTRRKANPDSGSAQQAIVSPQVASSMTATSPGQHSPAAESVEIQRSSADAAAVDDNAYDLVVSGYAAYRQRDFEAAEQFYGQALQVEPNHRDALLGIAGVYQQTARRDLAIDAYRRVLQVDPDNIVAAAAMLSTSPSGSHLNSESDIKHLLQRYSDVHHFHFALGSIYVAEQRWAEARSAFLTAHQLAPANANYSYNLAVSTERLGDVVEAVQYYEHALANAGEDSNVDPAAIELHLSQLAIIARDDR